MNDSENRKHQAFARVQGFGNAHASDFAPASVATQLFATLAEIIGRLDAHAATQVSSRGAAREELRADLVAINFTARSLSADVPGINDKFRVPPVGNDQILLNAARAAAVDAAPLVARFVALEMPADFLTDLNDDIAALEAAMGNQSSGAGNAAAARASIEAAVDEGVAVLGKLNVIMRNKYANDAGTLAEWASVSHIERAPRRNKTPATPTTGAPPSSPTGG